MTSPNDFTPGRMSTVITENAEMYDDWLEERGIISYRRQLRNRAEAAEAENARLRTELAEVKRERDEARDDLSGLAMYLGVGSGDETTTVSQFIRRIRQGIDYFTDRAYERACTAQARVKELEAENAELRAAILRMYFRIHTSDFLL